MLVLPALRLEPWSVVLRTYTTALRPGGASEKLHKYAPIFNRVISSPGTDDAHLPGFQPFICEIGGFSARRTVECRVA